MVAELTRTDADAHALVALTEFQWSRALGMAFGPAAGLALVDGLTSEPALQNYHWLPAVRGDLLAKLGRWTEAREELTRAAALTRNHRERELLLERATSCARSSETSNR